MKEIRHADTMCATRNTRWCTFYRFRCRAVRIFQELFSCFRSRFSTLSQLNSTQVLILSRWALHSFFPFISLHGNFKCEFYGLTLRLCCCKLIRTKSMRIFIDDSQFEYIFNLQTLKCCQLVSVRIDLTHIAIDAVLSN